MSPEDLTSIPVGLFEPIDAEQLNVMQLHQQLQKEGDSVKQKNDSTWDCQLRIPPQKCYYIITYYWKCRKKICNHSSAPEAHLAPWKHISHECCRHHQKKNNNTKHPQYFPRILIRTII